jgi:hypothetical protein
MRVTYKLNAIQKLFSSRAGEALLLQKPPYTTRSRPVLTQRLYKVASVKAVIRQIQSRTNTCIYIFTVDQPVWRW